MLGEESTNRFGSNASLAEIFSSFFEQYSSEIYIFYLDNLHFIAVNRAAREHLGYTEEEFKTLSALDFSPQYKREQFEHRLKPLLNGQKKELFYKTIHQRKDHTVYPVEVNLQIMDYEQRKICLALVHAVNEQASEQMIMETKRITPHSFFGAASDPIIILSEEGNVTFWNEAACAVFGYSKEEAFGKRLQDLLFPENSNYQVFHEAIETAKKQLAHREIHEARVQCKNSHTVYVEFSVSVLKIKENYYTVAILRDITERRNVQSDLEESRRQYFALAENAPIGVTCCDARGRIYYVNQKTLEILGSNSMAQTKKINLLTFPTLVQQGFSAHLETCLRENLSEKFEMPYTSKWGKELWTMVHIKPTTEKGIVNGALIILDDITARKQLDAERKAKEDRMLMMVKGIPSPAWLLSADRKILMQNEAAETLLNTKVGDICRIGLFNAKHFGNGTDDLLCLTETVNEEIEINHIIWDTWCIPLGEDVFLYYAVDVTKYKRAEDALMLLSVTDTLTNVFNRRYFVQELETELSHARRMNATFSLIMLDIDHFKQINDHFGHNTGDIVLKNHIAATVKSRLRKEDTLARWGGEEFVILLPGTGIQRATTLAEELRHRFSTSEIPNVGVITASFGVTEYRQGDTTDQLIQRADNLMYQAKAAGRNCVKNDENNTEI